MRVDAVKFAGLDERREDRPIYCSAVGAREERVLSVECAWTDWALDDIGVGFNAAVVNKQGRAVSARQCVVDSFGEFAHLADQRQLGA